MHQIAALNSNAAGSTQIERNKHLTVENIPIALVDRGSGTPTLLLHGIFDTADTYADLIPLLQGNLRCLVPDLPGFGQSGSPRDFDATLPHLAGFIDELLAALGITEPVNIVGYDIGATYGLAWAVSNPSRVRRLALMNCNFFSDYRWHPWARLWRVPLLGDLVIAGVTQPTYASAIQKNAPRLTAEQAKAASLHVTPAAKKMALRHYRALDSSGFRGWEDRLLALTAQVPTIVCWADLDPFITPEFAERFGAREVHHFPEYSHWLPLENPTGLAAHIGPFLK